MNAWVKSHDTGYATLFSSNTECQWSDEDIINFSWRLANSKNNDKKRKSMLELKDWTSDDSHFLMKIHDPSYKPKTGPTSDLMYNTIGKNAFLLSPSMDTIGYKFISGIQILSRDLSHVFRIKILYPLLGSFYTLLLNFLFAKS